MLLAKIVDGEVIVMMRAKENRFNIYVSKDNRKALERLKQEFNPVEEGMSISDFIIKSALKRWKRKKSIKGM